MPAVCRLIWFCCLPLNMVYSRTWTCWSNTARAWALTVNLKKTNIMIFQKRSRSQGTQHIFTLGTNQITHTSHYNYLGLKITSTGNFNHAVNELIDKARRAFYAIKRQCPIEIPIRIWLENSRISNWAHCTLWQRGVGSTDKPKSRSHQMGKTSDWDPACRAL